MRIKINYILAILGLIFALDAFRVANVLSIFSADVGIIGMIVLIIGIFGLLGIYFYNKSNYKIASLIYLIAGILIILMLTIDSSLFSCIFYILAAIVAFVEGRHDENSYINNSYNGSNQGHYFGPNETNSNINNTKHYKKSSFDTKLLIIPVVIVLVIVLAVVGLNMYDNEATLNVSNIAIKSEGYSMYTVSCDMIPNREYNYLGLVVVFYDSNNAEIGKSPLVWNSNNPTKGQTIKVSGTALTSNSNLKPARAELYFFDKSFTTDPADAIYSQNVTIQ